MKDITLDDLRGLLEPTEGPCISVYQPTHRMHPHNRQDPIRFRNLVTQLEASLRQKYPGREVRPLLEPFQALGQDEGFWNHTLDGLAVLSSPGRFQVLQLPRPVPERVVVAESFHTKPLLRFLQTADRYQVLCLSRDRIRLLEGNRDGLEDVDLEPAAREAIELTIPTGDFQTHNAVTPTGKGAIHHGQGGRKDAIDTEVEKFFRAADQAILTYHSRPTGLPLLLATLPQHVDTFRGLSQNPYLLSDEIAVDPFSLSDEQLVSEAWKRVEPLYLDRLAKLKARFEEAVSKNAGSADLAGIAHAVAAHRVETLMIEADRTEPGRLDAEHGRITFENLEDPEIDDLLDDLAEAVLMTGGQVVVVPRELMPTNTGAAAIYRF